MRVRKKSRGLAGIRLLAVGVVVVDSVVEPSRRKFYAWH